MRHDQAGTLVSVAKPPQTPPIHLSVVDSLNWFRTDDAPEAEVGLFARRGSGRRRRRSGVDGRSGHGVIGVFGTIGSTIADACLALEDGRVFYGRSFGAKGAREGEVVFNTAMSGYQEIYSDPSYTVRSSA